LTLSLGFQLCQKPLYKTKMKITPEDNNIFAVIIAIETYRYSDISSVLYAENDAKEFKKLLINEFGAKEENIIVWTNEKATKTALEEELPYFIRQLTAENKFIFYYAGHGFHSNDNNRLTVWDTHKNNLFGTTVSIQDVLLNPLVKSECDNSLLFIDSCSVHLSDNLSSRDLIASMTTAEFEEFSNSSNSNSLFCSCSPGEKSYPSDKLKHGIWTWHVIECLKGNVPESIFKDIFITDSSLQNYLRKAIPKFITQETTIKGTQTPFSKISSSNTKIIKKLNAPEQVTAVEFPQLKLKFHDIELRKTEIQNIKDLPGFKKGHFVPTSITYSTKSYVQNISFEEIKEEIQQIYDECKTILNLKRKDIIKEVDEIGASIENSIFRYYIDIRQHQKNPAQAVTTRRLIIRVPRTDLPLNFYEIFPVQPNEVVIPIDGKVDFDDLVEKFENLEESIGGKLREDDENGIIEYKSGDNNLTIVINTFEKEMVVTPKTYLNCLALIDATTEGLKKVTGQSDLLLLP